MKAQVLAETANMDEAQWLELRRQGIGSSDASAVAGINPWKGPAEVWAEKVGLSLPHYSSEAEERMLWGTLLEDVIAQEFARRNNVRVRRRNAILQHPKYPWMIANLDRLVSGNEILEIKTSGARSRDYWIAPDGETVVPDWYQIQVQHQLAVTGLKVAHVAVLIGGQEYRQARVERDDEVIGYLIEIERRFWHENVLSNTPPTPDGTPSSASILERMYPTGKPQRITLPADALRYIEEYEAWQATRDRAEREMEWAKQQLQSLLGEAEEGVIAERVVRWKTVRQKRLNAGALRAQMPDVYDQFAEERTYRRFTIA